MLTDTIEGLFAQIRSTHLQVGLRRPPAIEQLMQMREVEAVEVIDETHFRLRHSADHNPAEELVEKSVSSQWGLFELVPEKRSLEQIFVELTQSEEAVNEPTMTTTSHLSDNLSTDNLSTDLTLKIKEAA